MRRDINFFSIYHTQSNGENINFFKITALLLTAGSIIIILAIYCCLKISDLSVLHQIQVGNSVLQSPTTSKIEQTLSDADNKIAALNNYKQTADKFTSGLNTVPRPDSELLDSVAAMEPADLNISSISYSNGTLSLSCTCTNNLSAAVFVHTLEKSGNFSNVDYNGITSDGGTYEFSVVISLKEGGSK